MLYEVQHLSVARCPFFSYNKNKVIKVVICYWYINYSFVRQNPCMQARFLFEKFTGVARNQGIPVLIFKIFIWYTISFENCKSFFSHSSGEYDKRNKNEKNRLNGTPCAFEGWIIPTDCIFECSCSNFPYNSVYILTAQLYKKKSCFFSNDHYSQNIFKKTRKQDAQEIEGVSFGASRFCKLKSCTDTEEEVVVYCARS